MGRLIDTDALKDKMIKYGFHAIDMTVTEFVEDMLPTVEAIPKDNVYKAIQEMMKYEHDGFVNISLARLDEILKKYGVSENGND